MEECPRNRREDGRPAEQAEQAADQAVLDVMYRRVGLMQMGFDGKLLTLRLGSWQAQINPWRWYWLGLARLRLAKLAGQAR